MYRKQKSVQKSLLTSSERARVPIRALVFWDICTPMRVKMELRPSRAQTNASFLQSTQPNELLFLP